MNLRVVTLLLFAALALGCDGEGTPDAGTDARFVGVVLTVNEAAARDDILGVRPADGFRYYLLELTLDAQGVGPISVAPNALAIRLEGGGARIRGDAGRTEAMPDGCRSQRVDMDAQLTCRVAFVVASDAPPPSTLEWSDASYSTTASVPPLM